MFLVSGFGFRVPVFGFWVPDFRFRILGSGLGVRFRGGLVFKAHRLVYHSTLGSREIKKKKKCGTDLVEPHDPPRHHPHRARNNLKKPTPNVISPKVNSEESDTAID